MPSPLLRAVYNVQLVNAVRWTGLDLSPCYLSTGSYPLVSGNKFGASVLPAGDWNADGVLGELECRLLAARGRQPSACIFLILRIDPDSARVWRGG